VRSARSFVAAAGLSIACAACLPPDRGPAAPDLAAPIQAVLTAGPWRLVDYRADLSLDPVTQLLLSQQVRSMVVTFDGRTMVARSSSLTITRPYVVQNVADATFDLVSPDVQGAGNLRSHCKLSEGGRNLVFHAETDPWSGTGTLEREGP
jgi:hypothetical protein